MLASWSTEVDSALRSELGVSPGTSRAAASTTVVLVSSVLMVVSWRWTDSVSVEPRTSLAGS
jgi:hypothetical protein